MMENMIVMNVWKELLAKLSLAELNNLCLSLDCGVDLETGRFYPATYKKKVYYFFERGVSVHE